MSNKFIADVHLGKLARLLRLLGFDTLYKNDFVAKELIEISHEQNRILLSRNISFSKNKNITFFPVTHENSMIQLKQVVEHFDLKEQFQPFSICLICNGSLQPVRKENVLYLLEKNTAQYFNEFWQCKNCKRIYWKGSHYERMFALLDEITTNNSAPEEPGIFDL